MEGSKRVTSHSALINVDHGHDSTIQFEDVSIFAMISRDARNQTHKTSLSEMEKTKG